MYSRHLLEIRDGVLAKPAFAFVYEQQRNNEENRAMARALQRGLAAVGETAQAALEASEQAHRAR